MKRQGDILIIKIDRIPEGVVRKKDRVLAEGEATGHAHTLDAGDVYEKDGILYFKADDTVHLNHEEHGQITFKPGVYRVIRQREYEPDGWRNVAD